MARTKVRRLRQVLSLMGPVVRQRIPSIFFLGAAGFAVGTLATMKSFFESGLINLANDVLTDPSGSIWSRPTDQDMSVDSSLAGKLASFLPNHRLAHLLAAYVVITLIASAIAIGSTAVREAISRDLFVSIFGKAVDNAATNDLDDGELQQQPGGLAGAIQPGANSLASSSTLMIEAFQYLWAFLAVGITLIQVSMPFTLAFIALFLCFAGLTRLQAWLLAARRESYDKTRSRLFARTTDLLDNKEILLAQEQKPFFLARTQETAESLASTNRRLSVIETIFGEFGNLILDIGRLGILGLVVVFAAKSTDVESVGDVYFYVALFSRVAYPISGIMSGFDDLFRSTRLSTTIMKVLGSQRSGVVDGRTKPPDEPGIPAIELENVSFAYGDTPVLSGCSFSVAQGDKVLLVGPSGAGKTTLARLILGFQQPESGSVRVYGIPVPEWDWGGLLRQMSYAAQTRHILHETVRTNLFVDEQISQELLGQVLADVGLADSRGTGIDVLSKDASDLSEGMRQRLAIARILLDDAPIAVLDEPLSGVDALTFAEVRERLEEWLVEDQRTVLLISHRLAFASLASKVIVLSEGGYILEQGSPEQLARNTSSTYYKMLRAAESESG